MAIDNSIIPYAIPPLLSGIFAFFLGLFVFLSNPKSRVNFYFALFMFACTVWLVGFTVMNLVKNETDRFFWSRILYTGVIFIPAFYYNFLVEFLGLKHRKTVLRMGFILGAAFVLMLWTTRSFIKANIRYSWGYSSEAAIGHHIFMLYFFMLFALVLYDLFLALKKASLNNALETNRIKYMLIAFCIALGGSTDFLSTYHVDYYPFGFFCMIIFSSITSYAIIKHKLMDIHLALKKGFLYSLFFALASFLFIFVILTANYFSRIYFGHASWIFAYIAALIVSCLFIPLHNYSINFLNKALYGAKPVELSEQNFRLMNEVQKQDHLKSIATFASGMAHEIKNPLTAIKTFTEYLPSKIHDPDFIKQFTNIVGSEVNKIDGIVRQLLEFSKPSPPKLEKMNLVDTIDNTLSILDAQFVKYKIIVEKQFYAQNRFIKGDKKQLQQVFLNFFLNSVQAMTNGGTLTVSIQSEPDGLVRISISDTGHGISEENLPHIFDPFFTTKATGTGLGLAISHGILKEHSAKIETESQINKGTTFTIIFNSMEK